MLFLGGAILFGIMIFLKLRNIILIRQLKCQNFYDDNIKKEARSQKNSKILSKICWILFVIMVLLWIGLFIWFFIVGVLMIPGGLAGHESFYIYKKVLNMLWNIAPYSSALSIFAFIVRADYISDFEYKKLLEYKNTTNTIQLAENIDNKSHNAVTVCDNIISVGGKVELVILVMILLLNNNLLNQFFLFIIRLIMGILLVILKLQYIH